MKLSKNKKMATLRKEQKGEERAEGGRRQAMKERGRKREETGKEKGHRKMRPASFLSCARPV